MNDDIAIPTPPANAIKTINHQGGSFWRQWLRRILARV
jgi:hypothetical protein